MGSLCSYERDTFGTVNGYYGAMQRPTVEIWACYVDNRGSMGRFLCTR